MSVLHIILPIIVGGIIGYCTNYIAIKMMFRPHKAVYIGKFKLPFTPGIIPKNQKRVAKAAGDAISEQLLTKDVVLSRLEETGDKLISDITAELSTSGTSINDMLPDRFDDETVESASSAIARGIIKKSEQIDLNSIIRGFGGETINSIVR